MIHALALAASLLLAPGAALALEPPGPLVPIGDPGNPPDRTPLSELHLPGYCAADGTTPCTKAGRNECADFADPTCCVRDNAGSEPACETACHWPRASEPHDWGAARGDVASTFSIMKWPVTVEQYTDFLNSVAVRSDPNELWVPAMEEGSAVSPGEPGAIAREGSAPSYRYSVMRHDGRSRGDDPTIYVKLEEAKRYANWVENGQPRSGVQDASTTEDGSYDCTSTPCGPRKEEACWALPTLDEWYKAAYYDPAGRSWNLYPTGGDEPPEVGPPSEGANVANAGGNTPGTACKVDPEPQAHCEHTSVYDYPNAVSDYGVDAMTGPHAPLVDAFATKCTQAEGSTLDEGRVIVLGGPWHQTTLDARRTSITSYARSTTGWGLQFRLVKLCE